MASIQIEKLLCSLSFLLFLAVQAPVRNAWAAEPLLTSGQQTPVVSVTEDTGVKPAGTTAVSTFADPDRALFPAALDANSNGFTAARSNPDFGIKLEKTQTPAGVQETLSVLDVKAQKIQTAVSVTSVSGDVISPVFDVSPDGRFVVYGLSTPVGAFRTEDAVIQSLANPAVKAVVRSRLPGVKTPVSGLRTIDFSRNELTLELDLAGGTRILEHYGFNLANGPAAAASYSELVQRGANVLEDRDTGLLLVPANYEFNYPANGLGYRRHLLVYSTAQGLNRLAFVDDTQVPDIITNGQRGPAEVGVALLDAVRLSSGGLVLQITTSDNNTLVKNLTNGNQLIFNAAVHRVSYTGDAANYVFWLPEGALRFVTVDLNSLRFLSDQFLWGFQAAAVVKKVEVNALFLKFLGHGAQDPALGDLASKYTLDQLRGLILASDEYLVRQLYRDVLGREGSEAEVGGWLAARRGGLSREAVVMSFFNSAEYRASNGYVPRSPAAYLIVRDLYGNVLDRRPDRGGLFAWMQALDQANVTPQAVLAVRSAFLGSAELTGSADAIVRAAYQTVLHRAPSAAELAAQRQALLSGAGTQESLLDALLASLQR